MNPLEYKVNDKFVLEGTWFSSYSNEEVYGILTHESNNTTKLDLFGKLELKDCRSNQISIIGKINLEGNIYIVKAYIISVDPLICLSGYCDINHFVILRKNKINSDGKISLFNSFSFSFLHLREWLPVIDYDEINELDKKGIIFKNITPKYLGNIKVNGKKYGLYITRKVTPQKDDGRIGFGKEYFNKISYEVDSQLEIRAKKISIEDAISICRNICGLFEVLLDDYSKILYLGNTECNVFPTYVYPDKSINKHQLYFTAINYENIKLVDVINKWLQDNNIENNICFHRLIANYLSNINNQSTLENSLLNITQGIEMYYAESDIPDLLCKLIDIFVKLPQRYTDKITQYTMYIVDFDANKKKNTFSRNYKNKWGEIKYTISKAGKFLGSLDRINFKKAIKLFYFLAELKDTRVLLTHGNDTRKYVFKGKALKSAVTVLTEVIRMFILLKLEVPEEELLYSVDSLDHIEEKSIDYKYDNFN